MSIELPPVPARDSHNLIGRIALRRVGIYIRGRQEAKNDCKMEKNMKAAFLMKYQILVKITYLSGLYHFFCILAQPPAHSTNPALCVNEGRKAPILGSPLANQELLPFQQFIFRSLTASLTQFPIPSLSRGRPLTLKVSSFSFLSFPPSLCPPVYVCSNIGPGGCPIKL